MSLVQHVSAVEGIDREPSEPLEADTASLSFARRDSRGSLGLGRKTSRASLILSYDPTPAGASSTEKLLPAVGAYEVSQKKRTARVVVGVISCVLASGIVFGFAALKSVLVDEKVYRDLCTNEELHEYVRICYLQDLRLNLTFTVASVTTNISALLVGALLDRYGPRVCGLIGATLLLLGSLCMAFAAELPFDAYMVGHFVIALGSTFIFVPSFHLSNAFPQLQGLILALVTGAFDASASVFLLFRLLYDSSNGAFGLRQFFLIYLAVPFFIFFCQATFMPSQSYETRTELDFKAELAKDPMEDIHDSDDEIETRQDLLHVRSERRDDRKRTIAEIDDLLGPQKERDEHLKREEEKRYASGVWGALHGVPASKQILTPWFVLITLFTVLQMVRMNFFIATIWTQYRYMLDSIPKADQVNAFFDVALPVGGIAAVPFIGLLLDNTSTAFVLGLLAFLSTTIGLLGAIPILWAAYGNIIFFVLFRPLYYSAMSDYAAKVFGFATFGTVYGAIICLSGVCTFVQFALQAVTHDQFEDDPTPVNLALASLGALIGFSLVLFVAFKGRAVRQEQADEDERRSLLPRQSTQSLRQEYQSLRQRRPSVQPALPAVSEHTER